MNISSIVGFRRQIFAIFCALALAACSKSEPAAPNAAATPKHAERLGVWTQDYAAAVKQAKAEGKKILLDFTGSDWCENCFRLDDGVFSQQAFADFAKGHYVLVTLDFPIKTPQADNVKQQNEGLMQKFGVTGLPTIVLLDANENVLASMLGYRGEAPDKFIDELEHPAPPAPADKSVATPMPPATTAH